MSPLISSENHQVFIVSNSQICVWLKKSPRLSSLGEWKGNTSPVSFGLICPFTSPRVFLLQFIKAVNKIMVCFVVVYQSFTGGVNNRTLK